MLTDLRLDIICAALIVIALEPLGRQTAKFRNWNDRRRAAKLHKEREAALWAEGEK